MLTNSDKLRYFIFSCIVLINYCILILTIVGLTNKSNFYVNIIENVIKIYISLYIIWLFNPYKKEIIINNLDKNMILLAAMVLLMTTIVNNIILYFSDNIKLIINKILNNKNALLN
jgi:hypothetical protein